MNQREAVYSATKSVLEDAGINFDDGTNIDDVMTKELRASIQMIVVEGFRAGNIEFKDTPANQEKLSNEPKLNSYVSGLVSNWFRKDKRFNGGQTYKPTNPGSRAGQGDPQLKALRQLHKQFTGVDEDKSAQIKSAIDSRVSEIQAEKAKDIKIDISILPEDLVTELGLDSE